MRTWPHAPSKIVKGPGTYIVTSGTYGKARLLDSRAKLDLVHDSLLELAYEHGWSLQAWAVFSNHYHLVGVTPSEDDPVRRLTSALHRRTARDLNEIDSKPGRVVWYRTWQTRLTYEKAHLARLAYVMSNPTKHRLVSDPKQYPWCSMNWFTQLGDRPFVESVLSFDTSRVRVPDDF
jgi:putative transposase